jgi:soluble lytic murein transglycosylase
MRPPILLLLAGLSCLATGSAGVAQDLNNPNQNPLYAIRADRWADAQSEASRFADPVAEKLVLYYRLLTPGGATAPEIADFMRTNPDWPQQALLERRREQAIAAEPDEATVLTQCAAREPAKSDALLRCAGALANAGRNPEADAAARKAWVDAISSQAAETAFLLRWAGIPTADDQWARFQRLAWDDPAGAARQAARLDPFHCLAADADLALKRDDPKAEALVAALPPALRNTPVIMLDLARYLHRAGRDSDAAALWLRAGAAAQAAAPTHAAAFWTERNMMIRTLLKNGDNATAYALADAHGQTAPEQATDAEFLAGFIALRRLSDPTAAARHFQALAAMSKAAITQGRAHYWLGRTAAASGGDAAMEYRAAAAWPTTFYGQLAALALGDDSDGLATRIDAMHDVAPSRETVLGFTGHEVVRAAAWLVAWGDPHRARPFLLRMDELAPIESERVLTATLALRLGLPDVAVAIARRFGRDGGALPQDGWPMPFDPPPPPDSAVSLGIMRQESSFDIGAVSPSGARGLMQLMPATAQAVAKTLGVRVSLAVLTSNPADNIRLGTSYLQELLDHYGDTLPLAVAAYNGGPHRVDQWLADNGDPRTGPIDMIDWIELIPNAETRNYVQRVLENVVIYRARRGEATPTLMAQWTH